MFGPTAHPSQLVESRWPPTTTHVSGLWVLSFAAQTFCWLMPFVKDWRQTVRPAAANSAAMALRAATWSAWLFWRLGKVLTKVLYSLRKGPTLIEGVGGGEIGRASCRERV